MTHKITAAIYKPSTTLVTQERAIKTLIRPYTQHRATGFLKSGYLVKRELRFPDI